MTLLVLALLSVSNVWGDSYTITFSTGTGGGTNASTSTACSTIVSAGSDYLSGNLVTATKVYYSGGSGLKLGANSNAGTIKMNLSTKGQVTPTSIVVNAKLYNSSKATTLKVNGSATQDLAADFADYTFNITSKITYLELVTSKYAWISSITVNYDGNVPSKTLESIAISGNPTKTTYEAGESFDPTGLTVTGTYDDATTDEITSGITWNVTPSGALTAGTTSVSVTATVGDITSDAYQVNGLTVNEFVQTYANTYTSDASLSTVITGSKVKWEGCKKTDGYDALKIAKAGTANITVPAGTKTVHLHMVAWNGESADVTVKLGSTPLSSIKPTADAGVSGTSTTYTIATEPKTENSYYFAIDVNADEATTLSLKTGSDKRAILFGVNFEQDTNPLITADADEIRFDLKELSGTTTDSKVISATGKNLTSAISASMKEGSDAVFSVVANGTPTAAAGEFTVSYSTTEAGEYTGTVVLSSGEASLEIPVSASVVAHIPVLQSIYVKGEPTKREYTVGDAFETAGLEVWGKYDEGEDKQITEGIEWTVDPSTFSATTETSVSVVANALEKESEAFTVTGLSIYEAPKSVTYYFSVEPLHLYGKSGVSSADNTDGDIEDGCVFTESPTTITFTQKSGKTQTRFWSGKSSVELRVYEGSSFTIASANYNIIKVEFTGTVNLKVGETAVSDKTWTGKQKSITFVNTSTSSALTGITVTYAKPTANMTITDAHWATFCAPFEVEIPAGVKAYTAAEANSTIEFTEVESAIEAGIPVVVYSEGTVNKNFAEAASVTDNTCSVGALIGTFVETEIGTKTGDKQNYVLQNQGGTVGFYQVAETSNKTIKANRCYMSTGVTPATSVKGFVLDDIVTGISQILSNSNKAAEGIYDLNGNRLAAPQKGINIINGVKVLVK